MDFFLDSFYFCPFYFSFSLFLFTILLPYFLLLLLLSHTLSAVPSRLGLTQTEEVDNLIVTVTRVDGQLQQDPRLPGVQEAAGDEEGVVGVQRHEAVGRPVAGDDGDPGRLVDGLRHGDAGPRHAARARARHHDAPCAVLDRRVEQLRVHVLVGHDDVDLGQHVGARDVKRPPPDGRGRLVVEIGQLVDEEPELPGFRAVEGVECVGVVLAGIKCVADATVRWW